MTFDDYLQKAVKNKKFKAQYDALEPEYKIKEQMIKLRAEKQLTQEQLAIKMGTKQESIARFERGGYSPTLTFLSRFAQAIGMRLQISFI